MDYYLCMILLDHNLVDLVKYLIWLIIKSNISD